MLETKYSEAFLELRESLSKEVKAETFLVYVLMPCWLLKH